MKKIIRQHIILSFMGMAIYSGCAKQPLVASDNPMGGHVPTASQSGATPANPKAATPAPEKSAAVAASSAAVPATKETQKVAKEGESATTAELQFALQKIYFDFDSSTLSAAARQKLTENYDVMKRNVALKIRIEGNCDERGSDEYNLALGERRAQAAANYLNKMGIPGERLSTISYGKEKPADPGHDESAWEKNRRDDFVIIK